MKAAPLYWVVIFIICTRFPGPIPCRYLYAFVGCIRLFALHNQGMYITSKYIPREYLALKINYCRKQLAELPEVKVYNHKADGCVEKQIVVGRHKFGINSKRAQTYNKIFLLRDEITRNLQFYETLWDLIFKGSPLPECTPRKLIRTLSVGYNKRIVMDKAFFDSLKEDCNTKYPKNTGYYFNGICYRSASERDIAILYTELGIPFKYEPSVTLAGLPNPINPDFVFYIKELDTCKFHEHLGIKDSSEYLRVTRIKYGNYTNAGLIPDLDILFTYDTEEMPFDIRYLLAKLDVSIYGSLICCKNIE